MFLSIHSCINIYVGEESKSVRSDFIFLTILCGTETKGLREQSHVEILQEQALLMLAESTMAHAISRQQNPKVS